MYNICNLILNSRAAGPWKRGQGVCVVCVDLLCEHTSSLISMIGHPCTINLKHTQRCVAFFILVIQSIRVSVCSTGNAYSFLLPTITLKFGEGFDNTSCSEPTVNRGIFRAGRVIDEPVQAQNRRAHSAGWAGADSMDWVWINCANTKAAKKCASVAEGTVCSRICTKIPVYWLDNDEAEGQHECAVLL